MNTIILQGNLESNASDFRKELKELQKDWEVSYTIDYLFMNDGYVQVIIKSKSNYEYKTTLLQDADIISDFIDQWCDYKTTFISIS